jgi:hypothetical protein
VWVAPAHTFDSLTLRALLQVGLRVVSDGVSFRPYVDNLGLVWIPQQPWRPRLLRGGTSTLCFHSNQLRSLEPLRRFVSEKGSELMGVRFRFGELVADARPKATADAVFESFYWAVFSSRRRVRDLLKPRRRRATYVPHSY